MEENMEKKNEQISEKDGEVNFLIVARKNKKHTEWITDNSGLTELNVLKL